MVPLIAQAPMASPWSVARFVARSWLTPAHCTATERFTVAKNLIVVHSATGDSSRGTTWGNTWGHTGSKESARRWLTNWSLTWGRSSSTIGESEGLKASTVKYLLFFYLLADLWSKKAMNLLRCQTQALNTWRLLLRRCLHRPLLQRQLYLQSKEYGNMKKCSVQSRKCCQGQKKATEEISRKEEKNTAAVLYIFPPRFCCNFRLGKFSFFICQCY